jgi:hypothetical protein
MAVPLIRPTTILTGMFVLPVSRPVRSIALYIVMAAIRYLMALQPILGVGDRQLGTYKMFFGRSPNAGKLMAMATVFLGGVGRLILIGGDFASFLAPILMR